MDETGPPPAQQPAQQPAPAAAPPASTTKCEQAADRIRKEVAKAIVGQERVVDQALVAILADGHVLLEGVPGLAKTLLVRTFSRVLDLEFTRVQFTPDLMPSDVLGTNIFNQQQNEFVLKKGPVFTAVLLADEINRTPPKTQAALLEAMEERKVTIDGTDYPLPFPFLVFATQNPVDYEGTYPLPEAQQDRFLLKVILDYPEPDNEIDVLRMHHQGFRALNLDDAGIQKAVTADELKALRQEVQSITVEDKTFRYIYEIVSATRASQDILVGGSPRAGLALLNSGKALAAMRGRSFVIPDDIKEMSLPVLRHRIMLRPEAEIEGMTVDTVLQQLIDRQTVPR